VTPPAPTPGAGQTASPTGGPAGAIDGAPAEERAKILLVDDRADKLMALESVLGVLGQDLIQARSGKEALRLVLSNDFAVILLDVSMPVMDGFETAALIRQRKHSEHTPIIFITALNATETHASRGYSLGAVDYIYAPVVPEVLRAKVSVFIDLFNKTREVKRKSEWLRLEAERRAASLETRLDGVLNRLNVGVFRSALDGTLISANPAFYRLFGINVGVPLETVNFGRLFIQEDEHSVLIAKLESEGKIQEYRARQRRIDGTIIWVSISKAISVEADGRRFIDGLVEDITERKEAEVALMAKAEELARSNAELEQFAYIASHDLQEPLRMVSAYSSLLVQRYGEAIDERGKAFFAQVVGGAKRMQELIRDLLAFSKIGKLPEPVAVDCNEVLERVLFNLQGSIESSAAEVTHGPLPVVHGDMVLLGQLFQNLIGNGIKFRHRDRRPVIRIEAEHLANAWRFTIADNGIGIAPEHQERIFGVFQRLHNREDYPGTGIGLAICRKVVQQHGGSITVDSAPDQGSRFIFTIADRPKRSGS
jgi:hypothetical protein